MGFSLSALQSSSVMLYAVAASILACPILECASCSQQEQQLIHWTCRGTHVFVYRCMDKVVHTWPLRAWQLSAGPLTSTHTSSAAADPEHKVKVLTENPYAIWQVTHLAFIGRMLWTSACDLDGFWARVAGHLLLPTCPCESARCRQCVGGHC